VIDRVSRNRGGFTLLEVLFAMVILAVGLLGLQALSIGAFRSVARGEQNSRAAVVASDYLEDALARLRSNPPQAVASDSGSLADGGTWTRTVCGIAGPSFTAQVSVEVRVATHTGPPRPYRLTSYAFSPTPILGVPPC